MKVGEARGIYSSVLKSYNQQKFKLSKQRNELKERMESTPDGKTLYADEAATLDLQYNAVAEKQDEYQDYVDQLMEQWESKFNSVAAKQQDEAAKDYSEEMGKIMTVARRIMHGDIVPAQDEKKLMEFDKDLYMMAKNAGMMARLEKRKKYKSLCSHFLLSERSTLSSSLLIHLPGTALQILPWKSFLFPTEDLRMHAEHHHIF